ncbi:MAG: hypothetical protein QXT34_02745 [Candidatus Aenigmatarchaeota archaeon]
MNSSIANSISSLIVSLYDKKYSEEEIINIISHEIHNLPISNSIKINSSKIGKIAAIVYIFKKELRLPYEEFKKILCSEFLTFLLSRDINNILKCIEEIRKFNINEADVIINYFKVSLHSNGKYINPETKYVIATGVIEKIVREIIENKNRYACLYESSEDCIRVPKKEIRDLIEEKSGVKVSQLSKIIRKSFIDQMKKSGYSLTKKTERAYYFKYDSVKNI